MLPNYYEIEYIDNIMGHSYYVYLEIFDKINLYVVQSNIYPLPTYLRLLVDDRDLTAVNLNKINIFQFTYRKYFKKHFKWGWRLNWEKEKI